MVREMDLVGGEFTHNWFRNRNLGTFRQYVHPTWHDKPIAYLEIGVFEGMSMRWMLQHVLTHPNAFSVGIDPWLVTRKISSEEMEAVRQRAIQNLQPYPRCVLQRGNSAEVLRRMIGRNGYLGIKQGSLDLCMIDGDHNSLAVLDDLRLVYKLLKVGGQVIMDDVQNDKPKTEHVQDGLRMFLEEGHSIKLVWQHKYCECYEKV